MIFSAVDTQTAVWYPQLRLGSQHQMPKPLFLSVFWVCTAVLGFPVWGPIFPTVPVTKLGSQHQLRVKTPLSTKRRLKQLVVKQRPVGGEVGAPRGAGGMNEMRLELVFVKNIEHVYWTG